MAPEQTHFLLIPYSEQGHLNPMLSLASQLVGLGCRVTFVKADRHLPTTTSDAASAPKSEPLSAAPNAAADGAEVQERLRFVTLPVRNKALCVDVKPMTRHEALKSTLAGLEERQDLVAAIVEQSKASAHPITCVICDIILWKWVQHIARAHHLRTAVLSIVSALAFYAFYLDARGRDEEIEEVFISKFGMPSKTEYTAYIGLLGMKDSPEMKLQKQKVFRAVFDDVEEAKIVLVNSFEALEAPLLPSLQGLSFDVRFIGPCIPPWHTKDVGMGGSMAQQGGSIFVEDITCLKWLDEQENGSVLYVAFGSEGEIEAKQVEEIELGIEKSGYKFLWVVRPNSLANSRPVRGLRAQSNGHGKGMFVPWAPQARVLQHHAVGGFLTHSGWNSTLESLTFGVPMLCLPILGDQPYVANFVQNYLQVGIRLSVRNDGLVPREEVLNGVQVIMQGQFSQKLAQIQELFQFAPQAAHLNVTSLVQAMS